MRDDPTVIDLVKRARDGDKTAWDGLVDRFAPLVWAICQRYRVDADDVGQTVWLRLVEHLETLREPAALAGWLATTTRHECLHAVRERRPEPHPEALRDAAESADPTVPTADELVLAEERRAAVRAAFAELQPRCRELLTLLLADPPVPYAEISDRLGMKVGGIGPGRARCLDRLRRSPALAALVAAETADAGGTR